MGLVAPGTGLGQALMVWVDGRAGGNGNRGGGTRILPLETRGNGASGVGTSMNATDT